MYFYLCTLYGTRCAQLSLWRSGHIEILITMQKTNGKSIEVFFDIAYIIINLPSSIVTELAQIKNSSSRHFVLEENSENEISLALATLC